MGRIELDGEKVADWTVGHLKPPSGNKKEGSHAVFFLNSGRVVFWPNVSTPTVDYAWAQLRSSAARETLEQILREKKIKWYNAVEIDWALGRITFKSLKELKGLIAEYIIYAERKYEAYVTAKYELILRPLTSTRPRTKFYAKLDEKSYSEIRPELEKLRLNRIISFTWREDSAEAAATRET